MKRESWLPAAPESAPVARAIVREAAAEQGLDGDATWELVLATSEAFANAVVHGRGCDQHGKGILLRVEPYTEGLAVEVCDCGAFEVRRRRPPNDTGGRGIPIIVAMVDHFELHPDPAQTRVRLAKRRDAAAMSA
jgi:anti-sigma regulatory factor (Ser/Thr protein kinase)